MSKKIIDPSDTRELNRVELFEAIEAAEERIDILSEELDVLDSDMGNVADKTQEDWQEMHERRFEVTEEIIRTVRANRLMKEQLEGLPQVVELYYVQ
jgi:hypothetical protein